MKCRHCNNELQHVFLDLGFAPPSNAYLTKEQLTQPESYFPLRLFVCDNCWLVQTDDYTDADKLFNSDYAYFSSTSQGWPTRPLGKSNFALESTCMKNSKAVMFICQEDPGEI